MAKKGLNIYKRKDGRWEGRYKVFDEINGIYKYKSVYGKTYSEARVKLLDYNTHEKIYVKKSIMTAKNLFSLWLEFIKPKIKDSTYSNYIFKLEKHIYPEIKDINYDRLTMHVIESFIFKMKSMGLSDKYIYDITTLFKSLGKFAYQMYRFNNPFKNLSIPQPNTKETVLMSKSETKELVIKSINSINNETALGILISLFSGARLGELCALKWSDIDFKEKTISVTKTVQRIRIYDYQSEIKTKVIVTSPKTKKFCREIPIPDILYNELYKAKKNENCYILSGTEHIIEPRLLQYRFKTILKKEKLPSINFHMLRHIFATKCISVGFDVKTLSEILGHSSERTTLSKYVHSSFERKRDCMSLLQAGY